VNREEVEDARRREGRAYARRKQHGRKWGIFENLRKWVSLVRRGEERV
jgi:hypothetical protein